MKIAHLILLLTFLSINNIIAQQGISAITNLDKLVMDAGAGIHDKSQSKTFFNEGKHWAALATSTGTHLLRLDGTFWTPINKTNN